MRILVIVPSYKPAYVYGGPIRSISALCEALTTHYQEVEVFATTANGPGELDVRAGREYSVELVKVRYFRRWTKDHTNFSPALLRTLILNAKKYDVIHIHSWWNLVTIPAALICRLKGIRPVLSPRGSITQYTIDHRNSRIKRLVHFIIGRRLLEGVSIHSTSLREDHEVGRLIQNDRRYIIPNLFELPDKPFDFPEDPQCLRLVFLGRIDRVKNLEFLLAEVIQHVNIPFTLSIIGEGQDDYVETLKQLSKTCSSVTWIGEVDGEEKFKLLAQSDLLLLPSHTENYGNVVIEALSQGTPVLISDQVGAKEYVLENALGWVIETTPTQWAKIINDLWMNRKELAALRQKAKMCISRDFNLDKQIQAYLDMYTENLINRKRSAKA